MEERLALELRRRDPNKVTEIDLTNVKSGGEINFGSYEFTSLEILTISNAFLTSLKNFPALPKLKRLDLFGNRLSKGLEELKGCQNLKYLLLGKNRFKYTNLDALQPLASLPNLTHLELGESDFYPEDEDQIVEIRNKIFSLLPQLQYLEQEDINGKPEEENEDLEDEEDNEEDDDESEDNDDLDDDLVVNGIAGDDENTDDESESEAEEERGYVNGDMNGVVVPEYVDQSSDDAEDEDDDDEDDLSNQPPVRGKKRKFEDEGLP